MIGDAGAKAIADACAAGSPLNELRLDANQIGDAGLKSLAEAGATENALGHLTTLLNKRRTILACRADRSRVRMRKGRTLQLARAMAPKHRIGGTGLKALVEATVAGSALANLHMLTC